MSLQRHSCLADDQCRSKQEGRDGLHWRDEADRVQDALNRGLPEHLVQGAREPRWSLQVSVTIVRYDSRVTRSSGSSSDSEPMTSLRKNNCAPRSRGRGGWDETPRMGRSPFWPSGASVPWWRSSRTQ